MVFLFNYSMHINDIKSSNNSFWDTFYHHYNHSQVLKGFVTKEEKATIKNKENIIFFPKQLQSVFLIPSKRGVKGGKMEAWEKENTQKKKNWSIGWQLWRWLRTNSNGLEPPLALRLLKWIIAYTSLKVCKRPLIFGPTNLGSWVPLKIVKLL